MAFQFHMISPELKLKSLVKCFIKYKNGRKLLWCQGIKMYCFVEVKLKTIQNWF